MSKREHLLFLGLALLLILLLLCLSGCATKQEVVKVRYTKGCHIEVEAAQNISGDSLINVDFKDCEISDHSDIRKDEKP